jgi:hypothetical protein
MAQASRVSIQGPFAEYRYYSPEELKITVPAEGRVFQPLRIKLSEKKTYDLAFVTFTFAGEEDPNRRLSVECRALGRDGKVLGTRQWTYGDPRIAAKDPKTVEMSRGIQHWPAPETSITVQVPKFMLIQRFELHLVEFHVGEKANQPKLQNIDRNSAREQKAAGPAAMKITIEGPFPEYRYYSPEELKITVPAEGGVFRPLRIKLSEKKTHDLAFVVFTFMGEEDPNRRLYVECRALGRDGKVLGTRQSTYEDPRIRDLKNVMITRNIEVRAKPEADITVLVPKFMLIQRFELYLFELYVSEKADGS